MPLEAPLCYLFSAPTGFSMSLSKAGCLPLKMVDFVFCPLNRGKVILLYPRMVKKCAPLRCSALKQLLRVLWGDDDALNGYTTLKT